MSTTVNAAPPTDLDELARAIKALRRMRPVDRARAAAGLVATAQALLGAARCEAVYEATRGRPYGEVADELGLTTASVNVAVTRHLKALRRAA